MANLGDLPESESSTDDQAFRLASLTTARPPAGAEPEDWCRYVITQGKNNTIVGHRQGNMQSVRRVLEDMVGMLNLRRLGKGGRARLPPGRKKTL